MEGEKESVLPSIGEERIGGVHINPSWTDGVPEDSSQTLVLCIFLYLLSKMSIFTEYYH